MPPERTRRANRPIQRIGFNGFGTNSEDSSIAVKSLHPIKVCLLLRLGRADLAEQSGRRAPGCRSPKPPGAGPKLDLNSYGVSYLSLARDLAWYHFDRAICAHMRGDDPLALADVRALDALALAVETKAEAMGFARPDRQVPAGQVAPYIEFLNQLPEFRDDQERRARSGPTRRPRSRARASNARVAALIRDLDQVAARQWGQPGGVVLGESPICQGPDRPGRRRRRAADPGLPLRRPPDPLGRVPSRFLPEPAHPAGRPGCLHRADGNPQDHELRPARPNEPAAGRSAASPSPTRSRPTGNRTGRYPLVERWYLTLADDEAGDAAWLEAAGNIIQPENVRTIPGGGVFTVTETTPVKPGTQPRLRGESLRKNHEPTVAALMARRVESMMKTPEGQRFELLDPCRMAANLAVWDPAAAVPTLRELTRICREHYARPDSGHDWTNQNLAVSIARFALARDKGGDTEALREYAEWIRTTSPDWLDHNILAVLEPLHRKPDDPRLACRRGLALRRPAIPLDSAYWPQGIKGELSRRGTHRLPDGEGSRIPQDAPGGPRRPRRSVRPESSTMAL